MSGKLSFFLLSFNIAKKNYDSSHYLSAAKADLYFLQEDNKSTKPGLPEAEYAKYYLQENGSCNSVIYSKSKFTIIHFPDILNKLLGDGHGHLVRRACVIILEYSSSSTTTTRQPRIIVASFHNPNTQTGGKMHTYNAEHFFKALNYLRAVTGYPVIVGGDFNCELLNPKDGEVDTCGFIVSKYNPTIHRALTAGYPCMH